MWNIYKQEVRPDTVRLFYCVLEGCAAIQIDNLIIAKDPPPFKLYDAIMKHPERQRMEEGDYRCPANQEMLDEFTREYKKTVEACQ